MKKEELESRELWLDLMPDTPICNAEVQFEAKIVGGTLDRFSENPGSYDRIFLPLDVDFERWQRWYVQCFSRQLCVGGRLHLCPSRPSWRAPEDGATSVRLFLSRFRKWSATWPTMNSHASWLVQKSLRDLALAHGLVLDRQSAGRGPLLPASIRFTKVGKGNGEQRSRSEGQLDQAFRDCFGEWGEPPTRAGELDKTKLVSAENLLGGHSNPTVLVLSPHPDDELIGCGGTLLRLAEAGASVHVVQMTEGATCKALSTASDAEKRSIRWEEAAKVAEDLGFESHCWPTGPDYQLAANEETRQRLCSLLEELKPMLIFVPSATDRHPEHQLAWQILRESSEHIPRAAMTFEYPVWGFLSEPTHAVDVTARYEEILQALYRYRTAMKAEDYVGRCRVLRSHHGREMQGSEGRFLELLSEAMQDGSFGDSQ